MSMKIGLEFEGVITDQTGKIVRWSQLGKAVQTRIKVKMNGMDIFTAANAQDPIDRYDCLAEVRTDPIEDPEPLELANALLKQIDLANEAYGSEGLKVVWAETPVPAAMHLGICAVVEKLPKKETMTLNRSFHCDYYRAAGNLYRGGGVHINVSPIHKSLITGFALDMHQTLGGYIDLDGFKSNYRHNFLYRWREDESILGPYLIGEYMSFGMNFYEDPKKSVQILDRYGNCQNWSWLIRAVEVAKRWTSFRQLETEEAVA